MFLLYLYHTGNVINIQTGEWVGIQSGLGAGADSFYEYLLKVNAHWFEFQARNWIVLLKCRHDSLPTLV